MPFVKLYVPESDLSNGLLRKTAGQFVADYMVRPKGEKTQVFTLQQPVRLSWVDADERTKRAETFRRSTSLFRALERIAYHKGFVTSVSWRGAKLGAGGIYALNYALRTPRGHARGINIVRAFLEDGTATKTPLRGDWHALLEFLEIRPLFRMRKAAQVVVASLALTAPSVPAPTTLSIMS